MIKTLDLNEIVNLIKREKMLHHKQLQIKVLQFEMFKDKHPKMILQSLNTAEVENKLKSMGYVVDYSKTEKSVTSTVKNNKQVVKSRNLKTTNMVISW